MIALIVAARFCAAIAANPSLVAPQKSSDVIEKIDFKINGLGDGLESFTVRLKVRDGWHLLGDGDTRRPVRDDAPFDKGHLSHWPTAKSTVFEFLLDGRKAWICDIWYPKIVTWRDPAGQDRQVYQENGVGFGASLAHDDTRDAKRFTVRIKVVATNGTTQLPPSVVTADSK